MFILKNENKSNLACFKFLSIKYANIDYEHINVRLKPLEFPPLPYLSLPGMTARIIPHTKFPLPRQVLNP